MFLVLDIYSLISFACSLIFVAFAQCERVLKAYSHLPDSHSDLDLDSCTMEKLHIGSDTDSDPLIEI